MLQIKKRSGFIKIDIEVARQKFAERGLTLLDTIYVNTKTKMTSVDSEGYKYSLTYDSVKDPRTKTFQRYSPHNSYTLENLKHFIEVEGLECELLATESPKTEKEKMPFRCKCGEIYYLHFNHLLITKKDQCNKCAHERESKYTKEYISQLIEPLGYLLVEEVNQSYRSIEFYDKEGYYYKSTVPNVINGTKPIKFHKKNPYTIQNMRRYLRDSNIGIELLEDENKQVEVRVDYLKFRCIDCGEPFEAQWEQVMLNERKRCPKCSKSQSNLAYAVEQYLIKIGVKYEKEKRFNDCKIKRALPFDFYLTDYNTVIEVNGGQHYYENPCFNRTLAQQQEVDAFKKSYCLNNGIGYLEIPEWWIRNKYKTERYKIEIDNIVK